MEREDSISKKLLNDGIGIDEVLHTNNEGN
jgi:hypothetical protein